MDPADLSPKERAVDVANLCSWDRKKQNSPPSQHWPTVLHRLRGTAPVPQAAPKELPQEMQTFWRLDLGIT